MSRHNVHTSVSVTYTRVLTEAELVEAVKKAGLIGTAIKPEDVIVEVRTNGDTYFCWTVTTYTTEGDEV